MRAIPNVISAADGDKADALDANGDSALESEKTAEWTMRIFIQSKRQKSN